MKKRTEMKEHPILFSAPMVRANREGRKNQTRRIMSFCDGLSCEEIDEFEFRCLQEYEDGTYRAIFDTDDEPFSVVCRYGRPGDHLWVRESWSTERMFPNALEEPNRSSFTKMRYIYKADEKDHIHKLIKWHPSIHMAREASRNLLEVVDIRVERLQDITDYDCGAEGIERERDGFKCYEIIHGGKHKGDFHPWNVVPNAKIKTSYQQLWESINGPDSWKQNPWVWVIEFKRID
jgi:hypothetical protein